MSSTTLMNDALNMLTKHPYTSRAGLKILLGRDPRDIYALVKKGLLCYGFGKCCITGKTAMLYRIRTAQDASATVSIIGGDPNGRD